MAFDSTAYKDEFNRQNYDRVVARVPKGKKALIQAYADKHGISVNALVAQAIEEYTGIPMTKD